jgi:segregation and condensation protein A
MSYSLNLQKFQGPVEKLLELIEEKKLEINEISLAKVTDDFLTYLETITITDKDGEKQDAESRMRLLADFIVVASRLIFIKSKSLLSDLALTQEEEAGIKDLEERLKFYREFKPGMKVIDALWKSKTAEFGRPYFMNISDTITIFYPGKSLESTKLTASLKKILESLERSVIENQTIKEKIISIEEKIKEVIERLKSIKETTFSGLSDTKSRSETIIIFLAILHMAREQEIFLEQKVHFSDIMIKSAKHAI